MLVFTLFALINLCMGYAVAVLLGHGPSPWYAIFLPAPGSDVVQIDALEAEAAHGSGEAEAATQAEEEPVGETRATVNYPFPEMNEPEDQPLDDEQPEEPPQLEDEASDDEEAEEPEQPPQLETLDEPRPSANDDDEEDIEKFLAAGKREAALQAAAAEDDPSLSNDDMASLRAPQDAAEATQAAAEEAAAADESAEETGTEAVEDEAETEAALDQDDIAALFNQV